MKPGKEKQVTPKPRVGHGWSNESSTQVFVLTLRLIQRPWSSNDRWKFYSRFLS